MQIGDLVREHTTTCIKRFNAVGMVMKKHGGHPWSIESIQVYWNDTNKLEWMEARELEVIEEGR
tara:strand:+ start:147 stop:338 length:192 start_codon:yes stop_codon:yes gene_type:complete